jgi:hypothetical protein
MAVLVAIGGLGAVFGLAAWGGYVATDFLLYQLPLASREVSPWLFLLALVICYGVLAQVVVQLSPLATWLRLGVTRVLRPPVLAAALGPLLGVAFAVALAYTWTLAAPVLIRPLATWQQQVLPTEAVQPLQVGGWVLVLVAGFAVVVRSLIERRSAPPIVIAQPRSPTRGRRWAGWIARALVITVFLSGAIDSFFQAVLTTIALVGLFALATELHTRAHRVSDALRRIPLALRLVVVVLLAMPLARWLVVSVQSLQASQPGIFGQLGYSYLPVFVAALGSFVLVVVFVPEATVRKPRSAA